MYIIIGVIILASLMTVVWLLVSNKEDVSIQNKQEVTAATNKETKPSLSALNDPLVSSSFKPVEKKEAALTKKWPVFIQIIFALAIVNGFRGVLFVVVGIQGHSLRAMEDALDGIWWIVSAVFFWNLYKFKPWALKATTIFLYVNIGMQLLIFLTHPSVYLIILSLIGIIFSILLICYFNSAESKALFKKY